MKLTKRQKKLAEGKLIGPSAINGDKGVGKSLVAIARLVYLSEHPTKEMGQLLLVTPYKWQQEELLSCYNTVSIEKNMSLFEEDNREKVNILEMPTLMMNYAYLLNEHAQGELKWVTEIPEELVSQAIKEVKKSYPKVKVLSYKHKAFLLQELKWMSDCCLTTLEDYEDAPRKGCQIKLKKGGKSRQAVWQFREELFSLLSKEGMIEATFAATKVLELLKVNKKVKRYQHIIVDEAQDLTRLQLEFVSTLQLTSEESSILFLMDRAPSESPNAWLSRSKGRSFKSLGYDMTGKVVTLRKQVDRPKKAVRAEENKNIDLTPLEQFMMNFNEHKEEKENAVPTLPWYVENYKYINKLTGLETTFQKDSSAGEIYIEGETISNEDIQEIPMYSDIAAGMPIEVVEGLDEGFTLPGALLNYKKHTYILHVQGDSMVGAGIEDGDYVVIQAGNVSEHEIAAVYYNGATTLKRIVKEEEHILLVSENPKYRPIVIEDGDFRVMGKLIGVIKSIL